MHSPKDSPVWGASLMSSAEGTRDVEVMGEGIGVDAIHEGLSSRQIGDKGEDIIAQYLEEKGIQIIERNWRCSFGEVDIIAREDDTIVLVEVKTRTLHSADHDVEPELAVDSRKRNKYQKLALIYLAKQTRLDSVRFDVAAVQLVNKDRALIRYLEGAYEWDS